MRATTAGLTIQSVEGAPSGPLTLTGPPRAIRGRLRLGNAGDERVAVRGFAVRAKSLELSEGRGTLRARLEPGVSSDLDATLSLARTTPPGDYQVRLDFDGHEVDALVRVAAGPVPAGDAFAGARRHRFDVGAPGGHQHRQRRSRPPHGRARPALR